MIGKSTYITLVILAVIIVFGLIYWICYQYQKCSYNKGRCRRCKEKMHFIGYDHTGAAGFSCPNCHRSVWIDFPGIYYDSHEIPED